VKAKLQEEPGWLGAFTRSQAGNAEFPNGARIRKAREEPGDRTPLGTCGTVLGSISNPLVRGGMVFYFVEWDDMRRVAVGVIASKIEAADRG